MRYEQLHSFKCKVCNSGFPEVIDYQHYFQGLSYHDIIAYHPELKLNLSNLTSHFNARSAEPFQEFWALLKHRTEKAGLSDAEILAEVRTFYEHDASG